MWTTSSALKLYWEVHIVHYFFKYLHKCRQTASNPVNENAMRWGQLFSSNGWGSFGPVTDAREWGRAEQLHAVEKRCLLGAVEVSETHFTEDLLCFSRLTFSFLRKYGPITIFWQCTLKYNRGFCCLALIRRHFDVSNTAIAHLNTTEVLSFGTCSTSFCCSKPHTRQVCLFTNSGDENLPSSENSICWENYGLFVSSLRKYLANLILFCLYESMISWGICRTDRKCFNYRFKKFHIVVWGSPTSVAAFI